MRENPAANPLAGFFIPRTSTMIKPDDISVGAVVRLKSGSPKFLVSAISYAGDDPEVEIFGWADRLGFVSREVPLSWLVWPKRPEAED
jgi:uncharacterized protein YodC (DUF2158 family)